MSEIKVARGQVQSILVASWDAALEAIDGREITLDGIHGTVKVDRSRRFDTRVMHIKSAKGRRSEAYQETRRRLRDDWDSDLTQDVEACCAIAQALGVTFAAKAST